jgi:hypothetical protein
LQAVLDPMTKTSNQTPSKTSRVLSFVGFIVLAVFCGIGIAWIAVGLLANIIYRNRWDVVAHSMPVLIAGGMAGFIAGLVVAIKIARADPQTEERLETKYVGTNGRLRIYMGVPMCGIVLCGFFFERLAHAVGDIAAVWIALAVIMALAGVSLFLYDRIPQRFIIPIGIIAWLVIVFLAVGFGVYELRH